ncbi:ras-responsive element-binding protein 1-like isoform X2 [Lineus longissimus]|uniref:ras-responsive element-binding protein 1-like isoform X2 n=1 Tax=Lineus longissimus TaxID=88925 RepID=UPI002B4EC236
MSKDADEEGTVGEDAGRQLQDTTAILPVKQAQEKESIFSDDINNYDDNSSDSDAFHIDLKTETSPRQPYDSDSEERKFSGVQGPLSPIDNQSDGSDELDEETRLLLEKSDNIEAVHTVTGEKLYICPVCNLQLDNLRLLTMHIRNHNSKVPSSHSCTICGKVLCSQSSLDRHMLVHSGERPFKCQICNLAFTTNGNMHRHMRVHEKEFAKSPQALKEMLDAGLLTGYTPDGRRIRKRRRPAEGEADGNADRRKRRSIDGASNGATMNDDETVVQVALKKKLGVYNGEESPSKEEDGNDFEEVFQDDANQTQGENGEVEQLHCPICDRGFLCKYGLQSHLETHPEYKIRCQICNLSFRNLRGLNMHNHMVHIRKPEEKKNGVKMSIPVGFQDLGFVDFSIDKFPLIAKSWCEHNQRRSSSSYHNFECRKCEKAFPCGGALKLHKDSHTPETSTTCDVCECDFENNAALKEHQLSHTADRVLSESPEKDSDDDSNVSKEDFLAMLSLQGQGHESDENDSEENEDSEERLDSKLNQDYFYNIGQVNRPNKLSSILPKPLRRTADKEENNNSNDFADIQKIIQTANVSGLTSLVPVTPTDIHPAFRLEAMPKLQHISHMAASQQVLISKPVSTSPPPLQLMGAGLYKHDQIDPDLMCVPLDDAYSSDQEGSTDDQTKQNFTCKYCDTGFETFNSMKVHMRTHLGLSPYKCNMCSYASADKTTLIRHLRTHNGERPFQCKICDFAFTTKANCERHARKKHKLETKDEIDTAVGYNQFIGGDSPVKQEGDFASPDTVCKYCGIDFKFFRALKHHLRSHSSCPQKPYVCLVCSIGFSTRANCIRHIQKRHQSIETNQIEKNIRTNIPVAHSSLPNIQRFESPFSKLNLPSLPNMMQLPLGTTPPPAHRHKSIQPNRLFMGTADSKVPFEGVPIKRESPVKYDSPLDFSKKIVKEESPDSAINLSTSPAPEMDLSKSSDEPMDLSVSIKSEGKKTSLIPRTTFEPPMLKPGEVAPGVGMVSPIMPSGLMDPMSLPHMPPNPFSFRTFKCPYCAVQFSQEAKLVLHMRTHTTNRPFQCTFCPAGFTIKTNLDIHIRTRHLNDSGSLHAALRSKFVPPTLKMMAKRRQATGSAMHSYLKPKFGQFRKPSLEKKAADAPTDGPQVNSSGSGSDSNCELASVSKILNTTSSDQFQVFFNNPDPNSEDRTIPIPIKITKVDRSEDVTSVSPNSAEKNQDSSGTDSPDKMKKKRNSYANAPNRVACPYCTRTFPWISSLRRHILTHTGQKPYKCPECSVHFSTKSNRERHLLRKHGLNPNNPHTRQIMDRPYKCQLCVFSSFSKPEKLIMHYKSKHPDSDPPANVQNMASLERWDHDPENSSDPTPPTFGSNDLDSDGEEMDPRDMDDTTNISVVKATESDQETIEDEDDVKVIKDTNDNESPMMQMSLPKNDMMSDRDIITRRILQQQQMQHNASVSSSPLPMIPVSPIRAVSPSQTPSPHPSPGGRTIINPERDNYNVDKILDCWQCGLHFATRKMLLRHLKEHNIDYPYKCYLCDASYQSRRDCLEHKDEKHHDDWIGLKARNKIDDIPDFVEVMDKLTEPDDKIEEIKKEGDDSILAVERKVFCALCPKKFWSLQDLRRHMRSHTGEKPFECDICGRYFTLKHSMMRHRRKHQDGDIIIRQPRSSPFGNDMYKSEMTFNDVSEGRHSIGTPEKDQYMMSPYPPLHLPVMVPPPPPRPQASVTPSSNSTPSSRPASRDGAASSLMAGLGGLGDSDLLGNLLGVDESALDEMLDSANSSSAAVMLGMEK